MKLKWEMVILAVSDLLFGLWWIENNNNGEDHFFGGGLLTANLVD